MTFPTAHAHRLLVVVSGEGKYRISKTAKTFFSVLFPFRLRLSRENFTFVLYFSLLSCLNQITQVENIRNSINFAHKINNFMYFFGFSCRRRGKEAEFFRFDCSFFLFRAPTLRLSK
jgi:hypothetical protein